MCDDSGGVCRLPEEYLVRQRFATACIKSQGHRLKWHASSISILKTWGMRSLGNSMYSTAIMV